MAHKNTIDFLIKTGKLKRLKRRGWVIMNVKDSETVAEHIFRATLMASILAKDFPLNREKVILMTLTHDLAESIIGDIAKHPHQINKKFLADKHKKEKKAYKVLSELLKDKEFYRLWLEFEEGKTKEAKFVRQIDKLEMHLQAVEYEKLHKKDLSEFFSRVEHEIQEERLRKVLKEIMRRR